MLTKYIGAFFDFSSRCVTLGPNLMVQSTLLIGTGLVIAGLLRGKGAVLQSVILRATLAAVILCPFVSLCLTAAGVGGLSFRWPRPESSVREAAHGADRRSYASQLVVIAEQYQPTRSEPIAGVGVIAVKSSLGRRVRCILDTTRAICLRVGARSAIAIAVLGLCAATGAGLIGATGGSPGPAGEREDVSQSSPSAPGDVPSLDQTKGKPAGYTESYQFGAYELEAGFTPDEAECILGQPLFITFSVKNLSDKAYGFFVGGDNRGSVRHNRFHITAADANGQPLKDPYSYNNFGGFGRDIVLEPGKTHTERLYLGFWCAFEKAGVYDVTCKRTLTADGRNSEYPPAPIVTTFKLTIHPFDRETMRGVIAGLGKKLREGDKEAVYEASLGLSEIDDEEVIPHLAESLTKGDFQNRLPAVKGLSRFSTQAAAEALIIALKDPDYAVGEAAGSALRKGNMTDKAVDVLLKELGNVQSSVRALAARALGYTGSERALDPLIRAMGDAKPAVGQAAAEALGKLGHKQALDPLRKRVEGADMGLRVAAAKGLLALGEPLRAEWLTPVIKNTTSVNDQNFHESIRLIRLYGGERAAAALIRCLDFDDATLKNAYNFFVMQGIEASPGGPKCFSLYHHDPNVDGTPEQIEENRKILDALKRWLAEFERR
jgi:HEAT repeat protein